MLTLRDLPEVEYLDGCPYPKVSPRRTHSLVQAALLRVLDTYSGERGEFGPEWRFCVGIVDGTDTEFVPDIAFISYERLDALRAEDAEEPPLAPDVAIEIRSPSTRPAYVRRKIERYLRTGCVLVLDVDPASKTVVAHSAEDSRTFAAGDRFAHPAVAWLTFDVAAIFPKPRR